MLKFLIDECLSPDLVGLAHELEQDASHVGWVGLGGQPDHLIAAYAVTSEFVFVTNNGADFKRIYRAIDIHPGLVVILPSVPRAEQINLFEMVLRWIGSHPDIVNKLIEIDVDGAISCSELAAT